MTPARSSRQSIPAAWLGLCVIAAAACSGCANFVENRAIEQFVAGLKAEDLEKLRAASSEEFHQKALRQADALDDLKILRIPDGKTSIVKVEEIEAGHKRVAVEVSTGDGKENTAKREVLYDLVQAEDGSWRVDDVFLKQKKKGVTAVRSVTEQMDLLLTVREFVQAWDEGSREQVLAATESEFRAALETLPPAYLARLTRRIGRGAAKDRKTRPQAQLDGDLAVVRLPRTGGDVVISFRQLDEVWQVTDIGLDAKQETEQIPSLLKLCVAVQHCVTFLDAYGRNDLPALKEASQPEFYDGCLSLGRLSDVPLPDPSLTTHELEIRLRGTRADFRLQSREQVVQLTLHRIDDGDAISRKPVYRVSDATIYEADGGQEKRLSAIFTSRAMLEVFVDALSRVDLAMLKHCSTTDFSNRVWSQLDSRLAPALPVEAFRDGQVQVLRWSYEGALTRAEVQQGGRPVTYFLREERGRFYVDDLECRQPGRPESLKVTLEQLLPMYRFALAIAESRDEENTSRSLESLRRWSSRDFNRLVWMQAEFVPASGLSADTFLTSPLRTLQTTGPRTTIVVGDQDYGAQVTLVREGEALVVDDVLLIAGVEDGQRTAMKEMLRKQLNTGTAVRMASTLRGRGDESAKPEKARPKSTGVIPASYTEPSDLADESLMDGEIESTETLDGNEDWLNGQDEPLVDEASAAENAAADEPDFAEPSEQGEPGETVTEPTKPTTGQAKAPRK
jgi:hypothetical protein